MSRVLLVSFVLLSALGASSRADDAKAVAALEAKGAKVERDLKTKDKPVIRVDLAKKSINDDDLALLVSLEWLETLDLSDTPISDAGLAHLVGLKHLKKLDLMHTYTFAGLADVQKASPDVQIVHPLAGIAATAKARSEAERKALALLTRFAADIKADDKDEKKPIISIAMLDMPVPDSALAAIGDLPSLRSLDLSSCPLSGADLSPIGKLEHLERLSLYNTRIGDNALAVLKGLKELRVLNLSYTQITDTGLAELKGLDQLERLHLTSTKISDAGLTHLAGLKGLKELGLASTAVTDQGVEALGGLSGLTEVYLRQTKLTPAGSEALKKALPQAKIWR
jgi:hypothetical protein